MKMRVKDHEKMVRDSDNLAILNTDPNILKKHETKIAQMNRMKAQEQEINTMKNEISEIKSMMQELIKRL
jgi:hypothetical protein